MSVSAWEAIFMLVVLKIPLIYLGVVIWWAVRSEPRIEDGPDDGGTVRIPLVPCGWDDWKRRRPARAALRPTRPVRPSLSTRAHA